MPNKKHKKSWIKRNIDQLVGNWNKYFQWKFRGIIKEKEDGKKEIHN